MLALPGKPSIAVLPFQNMSGDAEQDYFADGMAEDITTALSRFRILFVISRNSSFTYKGRAVDVKQIGRELGVQYVLEGSVRKSGPRIRVTGQLIDASTGKHLWADQFRRHHEDIFELQDKVTSSVVGALIPTMRHAEIERAKHRPTESLDAHMTHMRGVASLYLWTKAGVDEALRLAYEAIKLDPDYSMAYGLAATCYVARKSAGWTTDPGQGNGRGRNADKARGGSRPRRCLGAWFMRLCGREHSRRSRHRGAPDGPGAGAQCESGPDVGAERLSARLARRTGPGARPRRARQAAEPGRSRICSRWKARRRWRISSPAGTTKRSHPPKPRCVRIRSFRRQRASRSQARRLLGRMEDAKKYLARLQMLDPQLRISNLGERIFLHRPEDHARLAEGLRGPACLSERGV